MTVEAVAVEHVYSPGSAMAAEALTGIHFLDSADLLVVDSTGATKVPGTDYVISGNGRTASASITALVSVPGGIIWRIYRATPAKQLLSTAASKAIPTAQYENELDRRALIEQEQGADIARAPKVPRGEVPPDFASLSGMVDGQLLEYRDGKLSPLDHSIFAGKFIAGAAVTGLPVPASGTGADSALRTDLASDFGSELIGVLRAGAGAVPLSLDEIIGELAHSPRQYGAVGDGVADDTAAVQRALTAARLVKGAFLLPEGTYRITSNLFAYNGIRAILGQGGVIKLDQSSGTCSLVLGVTGGVQVQNCIVEGLRIDANGKQTLGIYGQNIHDCTIRGNHVFNLSNTVLASGIFLKALYNFAIDMVNVLVHGNLIEGERVHASQTAGQEGIVIASDWASPYNGYADATDEWKNTFTNILPTTFARRIIVVNNTVLGGRYGIFLSGAVDTLVGGNHCDDNTRSISVQLCCNGNSFIENTCRDFLSSGILLGYSSNDNLVGSNNLASDVANSTTETALGAYVGCQRNTFVGNKVRVTSANGTGYMLYAAIHADDNRFTGNDCSGPVQRAHCAAESSWDTTITNTAHRAQGGSSGLNGFANTGTYDVSFNSNMIHATGTARPSFFMAQVTDSGSRVLGRWSVCDNTIKGSYLRIIEVLEETSGSNQNAYFANNRHASDSTSAFILPRGSGHFTMFGDLGLNYTATWDPASIANGASASTTIPVAGSEIGDFVEASFSNSLAGLLMGAYVSSAGTVTVVLYNNTGGAVDLASGTLRVRVRKQ